MNLWHIGLLSGVGIGVGLLAFGFSFMLLVVSGAMAMGAVIHTAGFRFGLAGTIGSALAVLPVALWVLVTLIDRGWYPKVSQHFGL